MLESKKYSSSPLDNAATDFGRLPLTISFFLFSWFQILSNLDSILQAFWRKLIRWIKLNKNTQSREKRRIRFFWE
eukprot:maker-scaffold_23-snap-gene-4.55-mRNA-1 protein AED:0.16 eAED:0.16 QI:0/0.33/0.25/0.75/0/0/4/1502/74